MSSPRCCTAAHTWPAPTNTCAGSSPACSPTPRPPATCAATSRRPSSRTTASTPSPRPPPCRPRPPSDGSSPSRSRGSGRRRNAMPPVTLRLERRYAHSCAEVWPALTEAERLATWFDQLIDYGRSSLRFPGGAALLFVANDDHLLPAVNGRVTRFDPPRTLEYTRGSQVL